MHFWLAAITISVAPVLAWLPGEHKHIFSRRGVNLFDRQSAYDAGLLSKRYLPTDYGNDYGKIRGVNLGSLFVLENWLADNIMEGWGCNATSEFNCVSSLKNQTQANLDFHAHWETWINNTDFQTMVLWGLNTVRIPVGYWFYEALVQAGEYFPQGGESYLDKVVGYANDNGMYVIIDLHGAPGAQATDPFTGQYNPNPGFYTLHNYNRTYSFMEWMTKKIHTNPAYSTVGMLMLLNEPERLGDPQYPSVTSNTNTMRSTYYPNAITSIRNVEAALGVSGDQQLHVQMMDDRWGSGDPISSISNLTFTAYDAHTYVKYATNLSQSQDGYLQFSCNDDRSAPGPPLIIGEWSLSVNSSYHWTTYWDPNRNVAWYRQWWAAQILAYEKVQGWVFWTWKTSGSLNDPRWDYQMAVGLGIIPMQIDEAYNMAPCMGVSNQTTNAGDNGSGSGSASGNGTTESGSVKVMAAPLRSPAWVLVIAAAAAATVSFASGAGL